MLYEVARAGTRRLVLRRTVVLTLDDGDEEWVEQLWATDPVGRRAATDAVRSLVAGPDPLLLGRPVHGLGPFRGPTAAELDALADELDDARVELTLILVGTVDDLDGRPQARAVDLGAAPSLLGATACAAVTGAVAGLGVLAVDADEQDPDDPDDSESGGDSFDAADIARIALRRDLDDALARAAAQHRWLARRGAALRPVDAADPQRPGWPRADWQREPHALDRPLGPGDDCVVAVLVGVDGGQIGVGNTQVNLYRYRLEPEIDLRRLLDRPGLREALVAAVQASTPQARDAAAEALRAVSVAGVTDWGVGPVPVDPSSDTVSGAVETMHGTVVLCDCRGVQVGDRGTQYNTFASVLTPTVAAAELVNGDPDLVEALVGFACGDVPAPTLRNRLAAAVCGAAASALDRVSTPSAARFGSVVENAAAVSVGRGMRQSGEVEAVAVVPDAVLRAVGRVRDELVVAAARAEERAEERERRARDAAEQARVDRVRRERDRSVARPSLPSPGPGRPGRTGP